jgi:hypothetical protein
MVADRVSDKGFVSRIHKELLYSIINRPINRQTQFKKKKKAKYSDRHFFKEDIQMTKERIFI